MDLSTVRQRLSDGLLAFAWDEWAQMGVLATPQRHSRWAQDPEALIVFTLEIARRDPRLFDEMLDWIVVNEGLLSVRRLRNLCLDDEDRRLVDAALTWTARQRPQARLRAVSESAPGALALLFHTGGPIPTPDEDFARAGFLRPLLAPSHKSTAPELSTPINLAFRLRQILGVGVRAEVMRILLTLDTPRVTAQALAQSAAYAKRNVHDALSALVNADVATSLTVGSEQRYTAIRPAWAGLLQLDPESFPEHRDWPHILGAIRQLLRGLERPELETMSDYLRSSQTRDLLESLRPTFAIAGIPVSLGGLPETVWQDLGDLIEKLLGSLRVIKSGGGVVDGPNAAAGRDRNRSVKRYAF
jgi:hypothetical protein